MNPSPTRERRLTTVAEHLVLAVLLLLGGTVFLRYLPGPSTPVPKDFGQYYVAGRLALDGHLSGLYPVELTRGLVESRFPGTLWTEAADAAGLPETSYFIYAPWVAAVLAPLALLPAWAAYSVAYTLNWIALALAFLLLPGILPRHGRFAAAASFVLLIESPPFLEAVTSAQASLPLFLLFVLLARDLARGRDVRAGLWWALATGLKLFPLLFIVYALARRRFRMVSAGIGFGCAIALASVALAGLDANVRFVRLILDHLPYVATFESNQSLTGFLLRLGAEADATAWTILRVPPALAIVSRVLLLATLGGTLWWIARRLRAGSAWDEAIAFSLIVIWMLSTAPNAWLHHFVALALPSAVAAGALRARAEAGGATGGARRVVTWSVAWGLIFAHVLFQRLATPEWRSAPWVVLAGLPFLGAWVFYGLLAGLLGRVPDAAETAAAPATSVAP
jgi:hypothetical protein